MIPIFSALQAIAVSILRFHFLLPALAYILACCLLAPCTVQAAQAQSPALPGVLEDAAQVTQTTEREILLLQFWRRGAPQVRARAGILLLEQYLLLGELSSAAAIAAEIDVSVLGRDRQQQLRMLQKTLHKMQQVKAAAKNKRR